MTPSTTYQTLRDILRDLRRMHLEAADCCSRLARNTDGRPALLADICRRHEEAFADHLTFSEGNEHARALGMRIQFVPTREINESLPSLKAAAEDNDADEVINQSLKLQEDTVAALRHLANYPSAEAAREVLSQLADFGETQIRGLGWADTTKGDA